MNFTSPTQLEQLVSQPQYDFLRTDPHLGDRILFLTLGGSHAYGTNTETSDVDIRGCTAHSKEELLGITKFEQVLDEATDTTIYGFNKLISLLCSCSPNVIELLGCKPEHYFYVNPIVQPLFDNYRVFLTQRAADTFGGYATSQLRRLQNALAHDALPDEQKEQHILRSMERAMRVFKERYTSFEEGSVVLNLDEEILVDAHLDNFPARQLSGILSDLNDVITTYDKLNNRNKKKDDAHLNKHAMHLVRLYLMGIDILEKAEINTYREAEHDLLMSVRNGEYQNEDHTFRPEFFELIDKLEKRFAYAEANTCLPENLDRKFIEEMVIDINFKSIH